MASNSTNNNLNSSQFPPPATPNNDDHPTVIVIVFISFGCLFLLCVLLFGLWCLVKRWHRKERKMVQKREDIDVDEHRRVHEVVVPGRHGPKTVVLSVDDDVRIHEDIRKNEIDVVGKSKGVATTAGGSGQQLSHAERQV